MRDREPAIYILASGRNGTLYIGVTSDLNTRITQHREDQLEGFTKRYRVHTLAHVEFFGSMPEAIAREKQLKKWSRAKKIALIERENSAWGDLYNDFAGPDYDL